MTKKNAAFRAAVEKASPVVADLSTVDAGTTVVFSPRASDAVLDVYVELLDTAPHEAAITLAFGIGASFKGLLKDNTQQSPLVFLLLEKKDVPDPRAGRRSSRSTRRTTSTRPGAPSSGTRSTSGCARRTPGCSG